jgi:hypothetical protein
MEKDNVRAPAFVVGLCGHNHLPLAWHVCKPWIEAALEQSLQHEISIADIAIGLDSEEYLLLMAAPDGGSEIVGCAVLMISEAPRQGRYVGILACGGVGVEGWIGPMFEAAKEVARSHGARRLVCMGRIGWAPMLKKQGCKHHASVFSLELEE